MHRHAVVFALFGVVVYGTLAALSGLKASDGAGEREQDATYVQWSWPVAIPTSSGEEVEKVASSLRKSLRSRIVTLRSEKNPVCCLWLEVNDWKPNPGQAGYVVVIQPGGGLVVASDVEQLAAAAERIANLVRVTDGEVELPVGLISNYPTATSAEPAE